MNQFISDDDTYKFMAGDIHFWQSDGEIRLTCRHWFISGNGDEGKVKSIIDEFYCSQVYAYQHLRNGWHAFK